MAGEYLIQLDADTRETPRHVQIARAIADDIARGRLKPDARLPGSRSLAEMLGVHRNTVNAAIAELVAQGWVETRPARGVFVREPSQSESPRPFARGVALRSEVPTKLGFDVREQVSNRAGQQIPQKALVLTGGVPDPRLFPGELLARAYRRVLRQRGAPLLDYGDARGEPRLRAALADMLAKSRGLAADADDVLITRGSQQAIWLAAQCLLSPGDRIGVESFGYVPAWDAIRSTGATLVPLALDQQGMRIDSLEAALAEGPLRAVYLTPHHQYPTTVSLDARRRLSLLALAKKHRFAVLEDDYSHEFHFQGRPRLPLASADKSGQVVYIGSLSKTLAPGLRIGYLVAPRPLIERLAALRTFVDRQGDSIAEAAVAELFEDGEVARHTRRMRGIYGQRRDVLVAALTQKLGGRVSFEVPQGGMALWVRVHGANPERWVANAEKRGVLFRAGRDLHIERAHVPHVRMGFTRLNERELERAVREATLAWPADK